MNPAFVRRLGMFYEREVKSYPDLVEKLRVLDQDSGVRLVGRSGRRRFLVFVTRFGRRYTMMTYAMRRRSGTPGKRLGAVEFGSVEELERELVKLVRGQLRAWVY